MPKNYSAYTFTVSLNLWSVSYAKLAHTLQKYGESPLRIKSVYVEVLRRTGLLWV